MSLIIERAETLRGVIEIELRRIQGFTSPASVGTNSPLGALGGGGITPFDLQEDLPHSAHLVHAHNHLHQHDHNYHGDPSAMVAGSCSDRLHISLLSSTSHNHHLDTVGRVRIVTNSHTSLQSNDFGV